MAGPRSVRFDPATESRLESFVSRRPGLTRSSAAALLVEEGLRMDAHPGVLFRDGPAGRRAVLAGGPDVWEVVQAIRSARQAEPGLTSQELLALVTETAAVPLRLVQVAVSYYADYPDQIDDIVDGADRAEADAARAVQRRRDLLGA